MSNQAEFKTELWNESMGEILKKRDLSLGSKGLYFYISMRGEAGESSLKREEILEETGVSLKTFYNYLNPLVEKGYIEKSQSREGGQYGSTEFTVGKNRTSKPVANTRTQNFLTSVARDQSLDLKAKALCLYLESMASDGVARIKWEQARDEIKIARDSFYKAIRELNSRGYIESVAVTAGKGFKKTEYRINYEGLSKK